MRDWCFVIDATSPQAAMQIGDALRAQGLDVDVERRDACVWCFTDSEESARTSAVSAQTHLVAESLWEGAPISIRATFGEL